MCEDDRLAIVAQIEGVDEAVMSIDDDKRMQDITVKPNI